jgi:hypothetical protein
MGLILQHTIPNKYRCGGVGPLVLSPQVLIPIYAIYAISEGPLARGRQEPAGAT